MIHFALEEWSDFARGRVSAEFAVDMQRHLDDGCTACGNVLQMWKSVVEVAGREPGFRVPDPAVRCVKALFNIASPEKAAGTVLQMARLVFSSVAQPLREGVRSAVSPTCHLLYEGSNWLLDLHLKPEAETQKVSLAGQILDRAQSQQGYQGRSVALLQQNVELARTITNEFGEFQMEFRPGEDLMLTVDLEDQSILVSALPGSATAGSPTGGTL